MSNLNEPIGGSRKPVNKQEIPEIEYLQKTHVIIDYVVFGVIWAFLFWYFLSGAANEMNMVMVFSVDFVFICSLLIFPIKPILKLERKIFGNGWKILRGLIAFALFGTSVFFFVNRSNEKMIVAFNSSTSTEEASEHVDENKEDTKEAGDPVEEQESKDTKEKADEIIRDDSEEELPDTEDVIHLVEGEENEFSKINVLDGKEYINYYVPYGTYEVTNNGTWCRVYIGSDEWHKNSEGYDENEIVEDHIFENTGEQYTLTVIEGTHVELTYGADVTLKLVE